MTSNSPSRANLRAIALGLTMVLLASGCTGASSGPSASTREIAAASAAAQATGNANASATPTAAAVRPGLILLDHFGNGADGTVVSGEEAAHAHHLWLVRADGSELHELLPGQPATEIDGPAAPGFDGKVSSAWSPDGIHIALQIESDNGPHVFETDVDGTAPRLLSVDCEPKLGVCGDRYAAYSPDGKSLAFARQTWTPDPSGVIAIRDLATGRVRLLEATRQGPPKHELGQPAWSPDGKQLAYYVLPKDDIVPTGTSEMFIVNADGTGLHPLVTPGLAAGDPHWSPDGSLIVFSTTPIHEWSHAWAAGTAKPTPNVYVIRPDGSGLTQLTFDSTSGAPSWTSDGKILFANIDDMHAVNRSALYLMDADGSNLVRIGPGPNPLLASKTGYSYYGLWQPQP